MLGWLAGDENAIDCGALLAKQLGITAGELSTARDKAFELRVKAGLGSGELSKEQASLMRAQHALGDSVDHDAILAGALGMSLEELQAARNEGKSIADLMTEQGLTAAGVQATMRGAYEAAAQKALDDGVITADQATLLLAPPDHFSRFGMPGLHAGPGH